MDIKVEGIKEFKDKLTKFEKRLIAKSTINLIALKIKNRIFLRTNAGKDADLNPFKPYSPEYAKEEQKTTVNLTLTGEMLNAMTFKALDNETAKIFFASKDAQEKAFSHNRNARKIRNFFGVNEKDEKYATSQYSKEVERVKKEVEL